MKYFEKLAKQYMKASKKNKDFTIDQEKFLNKIDNQIERQLKKLGEDDNFIHYTDDFDISVNKLQEDENEVEFATYSVANLYYDALEGKDVSESVMDLLNNMTIDMYKEVARTHTCECENDGECRNYEDSSCQSYDENRDSYDEDDYTEDWVYEDDYEDEDEPGEDVTLIYKSEVKEIVQKASKLNCFALVISDYKSELVCGNKHVTVTRYHKDVHNERAAIEALLDKYFGYKEVTVKERNRIRPSGTIYHSYFCTIDGKKIERGNLDNLKTAVKEMLELDDSSTIRLDFKVEKSMEE